MLARRAKRVHVSIYREEQKVWQDAVVLQVQAETQLLEPAKLRAKEALPTRGGPGSDGGGVDASQRQQRSLAWVAAPVKSLTY